ncbi:MAG: cell division protein FtsA [Rikenellaceae bacterium]
MESKSYIVAIDLGESNVVVVVGVKDSEGLIKIESIVSRPSEGVKVGQIENIALACEAIKAAIELTEERLNIKILEAYAGISGEFVRFACHTDHVYVREPQNGVSQNDVNALFDRMRNVQAPENETIMERIPQNYVVDDDKEVKNPVGSFGRRLSSTFNFILCANTPMQRLENALRKLGIKILKCYPNALSVCDSVLSPDEKEEGVAVVNIGGGLTDVVIYYRNVVRYIVTIPMGASAINHDIRSMMIPDKQIEKLKHDFGSAIAELVPENKAVKVKGRTPKESKELLIYNLAVAIEARLTMLLRFVMREIQDSGYESKLPYGIVLTGGSARLDNIDELFKRETKMEVRIGVPVEGIAEESLNDVDYPEYATVVGLLVRGFDDGVCKTAERPTILREAGNPKPTFEMDKAPKPVAPPTPKPEKAAETTPPPVPTPTPTPVMPTITTTPQAAPTKVNDTPAAAPVEQPKPEKIVTPEPAMPTKRQETPKQDQNTNSTPTKTSAPQATQAPQSEVNATPSDEKPAASSGRNWGSIFKSTLEKLNSSFNNASEDEEI